MQFEKETDRIYRLRVPFERIHTSVFLIEADSGFVLTDCASTEHDVDFCICPALKKLGVSFSDIKTVILTHAHLDHRGGLERVLYYAENAKVVTHTDTLPDGILTCSLSGHTEDSIGVLDTESGTLISGDALQGAGIDVYRGGVAYPELYRETLKKIRQDERIENILFSHAYDPWNKDGIFTRESVLLCLDECLKYIK